MPKGTNLHCHPSGGVYAETFIRNAVDDGLCVDTEELALVKCESATAGESARGNRIAPVNSAYQNQALYDRLVDSFSTRDFGPYAGVSLSVTHRPGWVDEVASRAATQNVQYMELMMSPNFDVARRIAERVGWHDDLNYLHEQLPSRGLKEKCGQTSTCSRWKATT